VLVVADDVVQLHDPANYVKILSVALKGLYGKFVAGSTVNYMYPVCETNFTPFNFRTSHTNAALRPKNVPLLLGFFRCTQNFAKRIVTTRKSLCSFSVLINGRSIFYVIRLN